MMSAVPKTTARLNVNHEAMANAIRALAMDAVEKAKSGHPGMPMGMADVATVLFTEFLRYDPSHPEWPDRDRFILSAGHGSMLQYALLYLTGYPGMTLEEIKNFRQWGAKTAGHPEFGHAPGIETTTGPLGQGISNAVGFAIAERALNAEFGELSDHYTYVIAGDGCLMEGISLEAASLAGHLKLHKLIVLFDDNQISIDGPTSLAVSDDHCARFAAQGWATQKIDGHDPKAIRNAILAAQKSDKPSFIACRTVIAEGAKTKAGSAASHGSPLGASEIEGARKNLDWPYPAFAIPAEILDAWRAAAYERAKEYTLWEKRLNMSPKRAAFEQRMAGDLGAAWVEEIKKLKTALAEKQPKEATRVSSQMVLEALVPIMPQLLGGSADLTGSNNTKTKAMVAFSPIPNPQSPTPYQGRYLYYGVREHAMAAAMNGIALHGGFIPYGGTFLVFTDYCRPAIRLSALMQQRVIYVMTHDSIGLGEDGPTHQPVEHIPSLRLIPNLQVFRPCDATETAECWQLAIASQATPSILALTRQALPHLRNELRSDNLSAKGGYVLREWSRPLPTPLPQAGEGTSSASCEGRGGHAVLIGTGSEVHLCVEAAEQLEAKGVAARVVSMPCVELFEQQPESYKQEVLGPEGTRRVVCEASLATGWEKYSGTNGAFVGMTGFGASAPAEILYKQFDITVNAIVKAVS